MDFCYLVSFLFVQFLIWQQINPDVANPTNQATIQEINLYLLPRPTPLCTHSKLFMSFFSRCSTALAYNVKLLADNVCLQAASVVI